jgi:hypothetical protein
MEHSDFDKVDWKIPKEMNPEINRFKAHEEFKSPPLKRTNSQRQMDELLNQSDIMESSRSSIFKVPVPSSYDPSALSINTARSTLDDSDRLEETKSRFETLTPYPYQDQIYQKIRENWAKEDTANGRRYGNIVFLETGTGKTYIAIMLLKAIFYESGNHFGLSPEEISEHAKATECGAKLEPLKDLKKKYEDRVNLIEKKLDTL